MSKNICVLTGARNSGMCKIYGYLRENGVNITGFHREKSKKYAERSAPGKNRAVIQFSAKFGIL